MIEQLTSATVAPTGRRRFRRRHAEPVDQTAAAAEAAPDPDEHLPDRDALNRRRLEEHARAQREAEAAAEREREGLRADGELLAAAWLIVATPEGIAAACELRDGLKEERWVMFDPEAEHFFEKRVMSMTDVDTIHGETEWACVATIVRETRRLKGVGDA